MSTAREEMKIRVNQKIRIQFASTLDCNVFRLQCYLKDHFIAVGLGVFGLARHRGRIAGGAARGSLPAGRRATSLRPQTLR